jgi:tyrosyl-tRNA synthetase
MNIKEQLKIISKGSAEIIDMAELERKLIKAEKENRNLIVKLGLDPTAPDIHLGHTVVLRKAKQFQDLGHKVVIIIGDYTGMIGDPSGKSKTRKQLTRDEVLINAETYKKQIFKILIPEKTEIRFNSEWLSKFEFRDVIELTSKYTVTRMLEREDFKNRFNKELPISIHEFLYPLLQGYDSVAIKSDIELGGMDQRFNILVGRTLQREFGVEKQVALFMPILEGIDGKEKMSKSLGNYIGIDESPNDIFGKIMSIPDELMIKYFDLVTDIHPNDIDKTKKALDDFQVNPRDVKANLAKEVVKLYHGESAAINSENNFIAVFQHKGIPENIQTVIVKPEDMLSETVSILKLLLRIGLIPSTSEGRRLLKQGGIKINGQKIDTLELVLQTDDIIQVGKRNFIKITYKSSVT